MKELNGGEIADFIKERQLHTSRGLRQARGVVPRLAIVRTNPSPVVDTYMRLKKQYGADIEALVEVVEAKESDIIMEIKRLNTDKSVTGIIVQLPLVDTTQTDTVLALVDPEKDVDGLVAGSNFTPPTVLAIDWLLVGYNIELVGKKIIIVGRGRLVGGPLLRYWLSSGYDVAAIDEKTADAQQLISGADVVVSATGKPGIIGANMLKNGVIVVDAGVSSDSNGLVGDVSDDVRSRRDILMTPKKGGVGPLTIAALFENLLTATGRQAKNT